MSLPAFSFQKELFSTAGLSKSLFAETDRFRLFAKLVYPRLVAARSALEECYCADNGRPAVEPVLLLGVTLLQELEGMPDRQAVEQLHYHAGWHFALDRNAGDPLFHPTSLVAFRHRLSEHHLAALVFDTIFQALAEAGLVSRKSRQRLDSTQMMGRVARMSRLDCVRESLRLALQELQPALKTQARPLFWDALWDRYVDTQADYRATSETLARKFAEAGADAWQLLQWLRSPALARWARKEKAVLLERVFGEQFAVVAGGAAPRPEEKLAVPTEEAPASAPPPAEPAPGGTVERPAGADTPPLPALGETIVVGAPEPTAAGEEPTPEPAPIQATGESGSAPAPEPVVAAEAPSPAPPPAVQPKASGQLDSARVQNPHEPEATYAAKGRGEQKKEHIGYKVQVAESVCEETLAPGEPTRNFLVGIVTHPAYESDERGAVLMEQEQARTGLEKPPVQYVDGAYVSAQKLVEARAEGREIIGPAQPGGRREGRFSAEDFQVNVEERTALCPAGRTNTQCSRLVEESTGKVSFRFEFGASCHDCPLQGRCLGQHQRHRSLVVGEHHTILQARRAEQKTPAFQQRLRHRNAIEGTQSELVRAHGLRRARFRGLDKTKLQNYFIGAACNAKRWIRREIWKLRQTAAVGALPFGVATAS